MCKEQPLYVRIIGGISGRCGILSSVPARNGPVHVTTTTRRLQDTYRSKRLGRTFHANGKVRHQTFANNSHLQRTSSISSAGSLAIWCSWLEGRRGNPLCRSLPSCQGRLIAVDPAEVGWRNRSSPSAQKPYTWLRGPVCSQPRSTVGRSLMWRDNQDATSVAIKVRKKCRDGDHGDEPLAVVQGHRGRGTVLPLRLCTSEPPIARLRAVW